METRTVTGEYECLSAWFAAAIPSPAESMSAWRLAPDFPRRLPTGVTFDVVLAHRCLIEPAYDILRQYEQTVGPAVRFTNLMTAAVLVPPGTAARWSKLVIGASWLDRKAVPTCLGIGHAVRIPGIAPSAHGVPVEWLEAPNTESAIGDSPLLTAPVQLLRCLAEARFLLAPDYERSSFSRAASAVRAVFRAPQRTTAVRPRRGSRDGDLMSSTFEIKQRQPGEPPSPEGGEQVGVMRRRTREHLTARGLAYVADEAVLIVSELVTNAIVHSGGREVTVTLSLRKGRLRIEARDGVSSFHSLPQETDDADEHGRGLVLVRWLAEERRGAWGVENNGANTWCELRLAAC